MKLYIGLEMLRLRATNPECVGHSHQIRQGLRPHLSHDIAAMDLYGDLAYAQFTRDLLVHQARGDVSDDLLLPRGQRFEQSLQLGDALFAFAPDAIPFEPKLNSVQQILV